MEIEKIYPLSPMQEEMFFQWLYDRRSYSYFGQTIFTINYELDPLLFEKSVNTLIERYDILRTIFRSEKVRQPLQIVLKKRKLKVYFEDISPLKEEEKEKRLTDFTREEREKGFDLTRDLLMRTSLFKTGPHRYKLVWSYHHILMDGWCMNIIFRDLLQIYFSLTSAEALNLNPVTPYRNYIKWLMKQDKEKGLDFWKEYLHGYEKPVGLVRFGKPMAPTGGTGYGIAEYDYVINGQLTDGLNKIARENRVTDNSVFQTLWGILLYLYNDAKDIVYGIVVSGRPAEVAGIEDMVGLFINTVPMRITIDPASGFGQLAKEIQQSTVSSKAYEFVPIAEIQANSRLKGNLIDHIVGYENYPPIGDEFKYVSQTGEFHLFDSPIRLNQQCYYNLALAAVPGEQFLVRFLFNDQVFTRDFIRKIGQHLGEIIRQVVANPQLTLRDIVISADFSKAGSGIGEKDYTGFKF